VVAAKSLKIGTQIQPADLKTIPWPQAELPAGFYGTIDQVAGNTVFDPIGEGEPVTASRLASQQSGGGSGVPDGMRAVSVHVTDSSGVLGLLRSGQKVDVQVVVREKDGPTGTQVRTALENLRVLSVQPQPEPSSQGASLPVVTLLAKPAEADVLAAADSGARVRLTLRNPLDDNQRTRPLVTLESVMRASGPANETAPHETAAVVKPAAQR
jgi:pilus assembly protein CpaB